jgi:hypothetical protein
MDIEKAIGVWKLYFPDFPLLFEPLRKPQELVSGMVKPHGAMQEVTNKLNQYLEPDADNPAVLNIIKMSGDTVFSALFPGNPKARKNHSVEDCEGYENAWKELERKLAEGSVDIIRFFAGKDDALFKERLNAVAQKELRKLEDTSVLDDFYKRLKDAFVLSEYSDSKKPFVWDFSGVVVHTPHSVYEAFLYIGHAAYTLVYLDDKEKNKKENEGKGQNNIWAYKIIEEEVEKIYKKRFEANLHAREQSKKLRVTKEEARNEWLGEVSTAIQYALESHPDDDPYTPVDEIWKIVEKVKIEKRFHPALEGKKLPFDHDDMGYVDKLSERFFNILKDKKYEQEHQDLKKAEEEGAISLVEKMYALMNHDQSIRDKLKESKGRLDRVEILEELYKKCSNPVSLDEKIDTDDFDATTSDIVENKNNLFHNDDLWDDPSRDIEYEEQRDILVSLCKDALNDSAYITYLKEESEEIICGDFQRFCKALEDRERTGEQIKEIEFKKMNLYTNYSAFSDNKIKAIKFADKIKKVRESAKKITEAERDIVSVILCLEEDKK